MRRVWAAVPALWAGYTWGSHLLTLGSVWRGPRAGRKVALTFDDGPDPEQTPRVLDLLAAHGAKATFFLIGERAARAGALVRRIAAAGHDLGNHTWSHRSLWLSGPAETGRQVRQGHDAIAQVAGAAPRFFRPPWGMTNLALFAALRGLGVPDDRIRFVPPGCDVPFDGGPPLDLRQGRDVAVLCVANWAPNKGIVELLNAFASLPESAATLWSAVASRIRSSSSLQRGSPFGYSLWPKPGIRSPRRSRCVIPSRA